MARFNVRWGLEYIRRRYKRIPPVSRNWYAQGGWLPSPPTLTVTNTTGQPIHVVYTSHDGEACDG